MSPLALALGHEETQQGCKLPCFPEDPITPKAFWKTSNFFAQKGENKLFSDLNWTS